MVYNLCNHLFQLDENNIKECLSTYFQDNIIKQLYLIPKKVSSQTIINQLNDNLYIHKVLQTISYYKDKNIEKLISQKINYFMNDTNQKISDCDIYVIVGLDTTTIYSVKYNNKDVTVLLLEATDGSDDILNLLLAHEFTHFVRSNLFKRDIFENCIGERFIVEGIGCNYSREIVPNKNDYQYCIVNQETVEWVKNNIEKVESYMQGKLDSNELMGDYFYMFADTEKTGMPVRVGYVYGYIKVRYYLDRHDLKIKDIIGLNWEDILFDN